MCVLFPKRRSWQLLPLHWRLSPAFYECSQLPKGSISRFAWNPWFDLCHQERPHESPEVKNKAVRTAGTSHIIVSSFFIPSLWICWRHEIGILVYSIAFCEWKSQRKCLLWHRQEMETLCLYVPCIYVAFELGLRTGTCNTLEKGMMNMWNYILLVY